jgi:class 3 adenylate cyclase
LALVTCPDAIVSNDPLYLFPVLFYLVTASNLHLGSLVLLLGSIPAYVWLMMWYPFTSAIPRYDVTAAAVMVVTFSLILTLLRGRQRVQFRQYKAAAHYVAQQLRAVKAQEAVLGSIVPNFVIEPLTLWLQSDFDPQFTVAKNYDEVCVGFLRFSAPTIVETERKASSSWLFLGHRGIDEVLATTTVIDKVKTVGDTVIVAGSFRGHNAGEAADALLRVVVEIRLRLDLPMRVGLHAGPVMGIVLGFSRLSFDIFGDTVNTASRVMSSPLAKGGGIAASSRFVLVLSEAGRQSQGVTVGPSCTVVVKGKLPLMLFPLIESTQI